MTVIQREDGNSCSVVSGVTVRLVVVMRPCFLLECSCNRNGFLIISGYLQRFIFPFVGFAAFTSMVTAAGLAEQRKAFLSVEKSLQQGQSWQQQWYTSLSDYPLFPLYGNMEIQALRQRLPKASSDEIAALRNRYPDLPAIRDLEAAWLNELIRRRRWSDQYSHKPPWVSLSVLLGAGFTVQNVPSFRVIFASLMGKPVKLFTHHQTNRLSYLPTLPTVVLYRKEILLSIPFVHNLTTAHTVSLSHQHR